MVYGVSFFLMKKGVLFLLLECCLVLLYWLVGNFSLVTDLILGGCRSHLSKHVAFWVYIIKVPFGNTPFQDKGSNWIYI